MTVTALAERYRDFGFRVIEGGKSNKLVVVNSVGFAESKNVCKQHGHVLRDIRDTIKSLPPDLEPVIPIHFRKSKYKDSTGRLLDCFDLTEVGFTTIALGYDAELRFRYALAFAEIQEQFGIRAQSIMRPVIDRMQELRGHQSELDFTSDLRDQRESDDADDTNARHLWTQLETSQDDLPMFKRNTWAWIEKDGDAICMITQRNYPEGEPMMLRFVSDAAPTSTRLRVFEPSGKRLLICVDHVVPLALVERAYARLGRGPMAEITLNTLRHYLAV